MSIATARGMSHLGFVGPSFSASFRLPIFLTLLVVTVTFFSIVPTSDYMSSGAPSFFAGKDFTILAGSVGISGLTMCHPLYELQCSGYTLQVSVGHTVAYFSLIFLTSSGLVNPVVLP